MEDLARGVVILGALLAAGCASQADQMRESLAGTPEWFETRRAEIGGDGYPDINSAPTIPEGGVATDWTQIAAKLEAAKLLMETAERAQPGQIDPEIDEWLAARRAETAKGYAPY